VTWSFRSLGLALAAPALALCISACGSSSNSSSSSTAATTSAAIGNMTVLEGTAPDYLDPQQGITTQSAEATWVAYLGLYSYAHADGVAGTKVIPALATALPKISPDGKTYTMTLRKGLVYSDGTSVKAGDFTHAIERAIKLNWNNKQFLTQNIQGAEAFDKGTVSSISGIKTDDASGKITVKLVEPYGAFLNILSFAATGLVPSSTPMTSLTNNPPPGVGPMMIKNVVPNQGFEEEINPRWAAEAIPGIPSAHVNVTVKVQSNTQTEAEQVLSNSADMFDWGDTLPPAIIPQLQSQASDRYVAEPIPETLYFFLNAKTKPFNNKLAREAVIYALNRPALSRLDSGNITPDCYFLPSQLVGHPTAPCPYGDPSSTGNLAKAKELVRESGMAGAPVTVWGQGRAPRREYIDNYTQILNSIGFKATEKIIADSTYFATIGNLKLNPQTGFADWSQDFPNPVDFYQLLISKAIQPTGNNNFGQISDSHLDSTYETLSKISAGKLAATAPQWEALEKYVAKEAYVGVFGYEKVPKFTSNRIKFSSLVFHPLYGPDWTTLELK
jgi:peptide/nickel transport system substrate-binding protein